MYFDLHNNIMHTHKFTYSKVPGIDVFITKWKSYITISFFATQALSNST